MRISCACCLCSGRNGPLRLPTFFSDSAAADLLTLEAVAFLMADLVFFARRTGRERRDLTEGGEVAAGDDEDDEEVDDGRGRDAGAGRMADSHLIFWVC